jgi:AraC-like DNA-binding protein
VETEALTGPERVEAWRPPVAGVREVFHARFVDHAYPPHTHDAWGILLVEAGVVRYRLDRHDHGSFRSVVTVLPPHVVHDGRAATGAGFRKRVLYLEPGVLGEARAGRAVDAPTLADPVLGDRLRSLHAFLRGDGPVTDPLEAEARLAFVVEHLAAHLDRRVPGPATTRVAGGAVARRARRQLAADLRGLLDGPDGGSVTLAAAGAALGASPTHLVRVFTAAYGMPPHAYLVARRVDDARGRLLDGQAPADVAAAAGFHDQAHLTRHFRRHVGTTPARYAASGSGERGRGR